MVSYSWGGEGARIFFIWLRLVPQAVDGGNAATLALLNPTYYLVQADIALHLAAYGFDARGYALNDATEPVPT
jgi:hypothetical protein